MSTKPSRPPGNLSHLQRLANAAAAEAKMPEGGDLVAWLHERAGTPVLAGRGTTRQP